MDKFHLTESPKAASTRINLVTHKRLKSKGYGHGLQSPGGVRQLPKPEKATAIHLVARDVLVTLGLFQQFVINHCFKISVSYRGGDLVQTAQPYGLLTSNVRIKLIRSYHPKFPTIHIRNI